MKKIFTVVFLGFLLVAGVAIADDTKVGYIDLQRALLESDAGKKAKTDLEALERSKKSSIDEKVKAINKVEEELAKQSSVLSPEARKSKEEDLEKLQRDFQRMVADARAELQKKEGELTEAILRDMADVVDAFGQAEGYSMIFRSEVLLQAKKDLDITDIVIKKFNESRGKTKEEPKDKPKDKSKDKSKGKN